MSSSGAYFRSYTVFSTLKNNHCRSIVRQVTESNNDKCARSCADQYDCHGWLKLDGNNCYHLSRINNNPGYNFFVDCRELQCGVTAVNNNNDMRTCSSVPDLSSCPGSTCSLDGQRCCKSGTDYYCAGGTWTSIGDVC